jgi:hypothetical protein
MLTTVLVCAMAPYVWAGCLIQPDAQGHVTIPNSVT